MLLEELLHLVDVGAEEEGVPAGGGVRSGQTAAGSVGEGGW